MSAPAEGYKQTIGEAVRAKTGLTPDSYYSALKFRWLLDQIPQGRAMAAEGRLLGGTLDTWIIWKLTGGKRFVTDVCSA
jgi:glycerol kinase